MISGAAGGFPIAHPSEAKQRLLNSPFMHFKDLHPDISKWQDSSTFLSFC